MSGCKHGHEAHSCTSCYAERRTEQLTAERAVLEKALSATRDEADQMKRVVSELEAERDALQAEVEQVADSFEKLSEVEFTTRTQRDALQADVLRLGDVVLERNGELRELREAAEAYVNAEDDDRAEEFDALVAVLAKVSS